MILEEVVVAQAIASEHTRKEKIRLEYRNPQYDGRFQFAALVLMQWRDRGVGSWGSCPQCTKKKEHQNYDKKINSNCNEGHR